MGDGWCVIDVLLVVRGPGLASACDTGKLGLESGGRAVPPPSFSRVDGGFKQVEMWGNSCVSSVWGALFV